MSKPIEYATPSTPAPTPPPPSALWVVLMIVFIDLLGFGIILPQLPFFGDRYHASAVQVAVVFSIYSVCQFVATPFLGMLSDRIGRRPVLVFSQIGSSIGYALLGVVTLIDLPSARVALGLIYLARIIDGLTGGNISTAQAYISDVTTPATRAKGMGLFGATFGIGFALGPAIAGLIGNDTTRASFPAFFAAIFSLTAAALSYLKLPESRPTQPTHEQAWLHPSRFLPIVRQKTLFQLLLISFTAMTAFTMLEGTIGLFLAAKYTHGPDHRPWGTQQLGMYFGYIGLFILVVQGGLMGRLVKTFGEWPVTITGSSLVAVAMGLYVVVGREPTLSLLLFAGAVNAIGRSCQQPPISTLMSKISDRSMQGTVFGLYHGLGSLARSIGPVVAGMLFQHVGKTSQFVLAGTMMAGVAVWLTTIRTRTARPAESVDRSEVKTSPAVE